MLDHTTTTTGPGCHHRRSGSGRYLVCLRGAFGGQSAYRRALTNGLLCETLPVPSTGHPLLVTRELSVGRISRLEAGTITRGEA